MRIRVAAVGLLAALVVAGCGGSGGVTVEGKVVNGGKEYNPTTDGDVIVRITDAGGKAYTGKAEANGTFHIEPAAGGGKGVPPGSYKVAVTRYPSKADIEKLKGPPTPLNKDLPETWEVASGKTFTLDISKVK